MRVFLAKLLSGHAIIGLLPAAALLTFGAPARVLALESLETFLKASEEQSFDAREAALLAQQRETESSREWYGLVPSISASAKYTRNQYEAVARTPATTDGDGNLLTPPGRGVFQARDQQEFNVQANVPLIDVPRWRRIAAGERTAEAAEAGRDNTRLLLHRSVTQRYYTLIAAEALSQAALSALEASEKSLAQMQTRFAEGMASQLDVSRAQAEVERNRQILADAVYQVAITRRALSTLSGLVPGAGAPRLRAELEAEDSLESWLRLPTETLPEVRVALAQQRAASASMDAQRAQFAPTVEGFANERFTNSAGFGKSPAYAVGVSASLRLDVANGFQARALSQAADLSKVRAERSAREALDRVHDAWFEVARQIEKGRAARVRLDAAALAAKVARDRNEAGTTTFLDVVLADRDELSARASAIQADADLCRARLELRFLANRPHQSSMCAEEP
jgi:outer membrane protein TolC